MSPDTDTLTTTMKPSALYCYLDSYRVSPKALAHTLRSADASNLQTLEDRLARFDDTTRPGRRLLATVYASADAPNLSANVTLLEGKRGVSLLLGGTIREAALVSAAVGLAEDI